MKGKFYVVLVWVLSLSLLIFVNGCSIQETQKDTNVIKLAALLPLSGGLGSKGEIRKLAIEMGVEDTNKNWEEEGLDLQFELTVEDSQSDPEVALSKAKKLWEEGHEIFIAGSSAEVESIQPWASEQGAIVISYSSTSPTLGIEGDSVFRMVPDDTEQAKALANLLAYEGVYAVVPVYRNDIYGSELTKQFTEEFESLHGTVTEPVIYQPKETDWELVSKKIANAVKSLEMEKERIAVVPVAFDEIADMLRNSDKEDSMDGIRWFGTDTVTLSPVILDDEEIAQKASQVNLTGVTFGIPDSTLFNTIQSELETFTEGPFLPDALFAYDIPGMLASVMNQLKDPFDREELMNNMIEGSATYAGVTGWTALNEKGDRKYYHYDIWEVQEDIEDSYNWIQTAKYLRNPGLPGYISPN
ncbi:ABC transporter substrate-binding protein [Bacillus sp. FJAT-49711]|uniref:ABC transporter substrate-binding protein n=1 Tax=Bacillus sp. FJAT-49711 TaxID=2833585 RepID=UPI001BC9889B|nr:ABC transporter substrate-binding protein [Bacillus sp. FJAT-49711]MBS4220327.1 ABC transporter substrate-binding protein [Bacillus sp. FJAT-49711]